MDVNNVEIKDGDLAQNNVVASSVGEVSNRRVDSGRKKRRRTKSKRKCMKPFRKAPWQNDIRNKRFRKIVLAKTHAPFNNNQFLMEIHKPEPENNFNRTPARTRDSSFSVDSEENYFFSLPEDEEEYLTKEFSSVYEDAQCERLSNMSKNELIQEYLLLEAKYDNLMKKSDRLKPRCIDEETDNTTERNTLVNSVMMNDGDSTVFTNDSATNDVSVDSLMCRLKDQENKIRELQLANEKLRLDNDALLKRPRVSSSEDSESDSSTSSESSSSSESSESSSPVVETVEEMNDDSEIHNGHNGGIEEIEPQEPLVNGFHSPSE